MVYKERAMKITPILAPNLLDEPPKKATTVEDIANAVDTLPTLARAIFDIMIEMEGKANVHPTESATESPAHPCPRPQA